MALDVFPATGLSLSFSMSVSLEISSVPAPWHGEPSHEARSRLHLGRLGIPQDLGGLTGCGSWQSQLPCCISHGKSSGRHEVRCREHPCARSRCWEKEEHVPTASLWISSPSAWESDSSLPVDLALLPMGLTPLHGSDSLLLVDFTPPCGFNPSPHGSAPLSRRFRAAGPAEAGSRSHSL